MNSKTVLVTGGAGYIGAHTCKALARAGYTVVAYDNLSRGHDWCVKWGPLETGDVLDKARLVDVMNRHRPAAVMHFAAFAYVGESVNHPEMYYRNNMVGSLTLIEAMVAAGVPGIVLSSTCAIYGAPERLPMAEDHPKAPINPYGYSKLVAERMLADAETAHGIRSVSLRYFNAAGADPDGEIGEAHDPETHLIPLVLDAAAGSGPKLMVYGDDYDTADGTCVRDYVHVNDLAQAHVLALQRLAAGSASDAYNLGYGRGFSIRQVIETAERVTGKPVPFEVTGRRAGDPAALVADAAKVRADLGWTPGHDDLDAIIETAWRWHRQYRHGA